MKETKKEKIQRLQNRQFVLRSRARLTPTQKKVLLQEKKRILKRQRFAQKQEMRESKVKKKKRIKSNSRNKRNLSYVPVRIPTIRPITLDLFR